MPGVFKERISSGVTGREHAYATSSSIGALSQRDRPAGSFLVDLGGETRFAGTAGAVGSGGGGVTRAAGVTGSLGAGRLGAFRAGGRRGRGGAGGGGRRWIPWSGPRWAIEGGSATLTAVTAGLPPPGPPGAAEGAGGL